MAGARDEDDWVGTPPEGRHSRERADPGYWTRQRPPALILGLFAIVVLVLIVVLLLA